MQLKCKKKKICAVCGEDAETYQICKKWFTKFRAGDFLLDDAPQSGRPVEIKSDQIETLRTISVITTREIVVILKISTSSVENRLYPLGYVHRFDVWVPHKQKKNFLTVISTCNSLLKYNENVPFLKQIVMGNKKYILNAWNRRDHGASEMNHHQPHQRPVFIQRRWYIYGGTVRESSIMSSFQKTKRLIPTSTAPN